MTGRTLRRESAIVDNCQRCGVELRPFGWWNDPESSDIGRGHLSRFCETCLPVILSEAGKRSARIRRREAADMAEWIVELRRKGMTIMQIAAKVDRSKRTVQYALRRAGL